MITTILIAAAILIAGVLALAAMKPNSFEVRRTASINAGPDKIFPLVNDLRVHQSWSPFDQDPATKRAYTNTTAGKGAALEFDGGMKAGVGQLAITDAVAPSKILMTLKMSKPMKCDNIVEFTFEPKGNATNVTWAMHGPQPFMAKIMSMFINCDKMCGGQFEKGLGKLKSLAEA